MHMELRCHVCWLKSEKGIRCESGTIPVAVYPDSFMKSFGLLHSLPLAKSWEGATNGDESEDLPVHLDDWYLQDTGKNQNLFFNHCFLRRLRA